MKFRRITAKRALLLIATTAALLLVASSTKINSGRFLQSDGTVTTTSTDPSTNTTTDPGTTTDPANTTDSTNTTEPVITDPENSTNNTTTTDPVLTDPPTNTTEPPTNTTEPPTNTTDPATNTTEPPTNTTDPATNTTEPPTNTTQPETEPEKPVIPEENFYDYTCYKCVYLDLNFDDRSCFKFNETRAKTAVKDYAGCMSAGYIVPNNTEFIDFGDLRNTSYQVSRSCNKTGEEILFQLSSSLMDVNQVNATIASESMPENEIDAYLGTTCDKNAQCGSETNGKGLQSYESAPSENITIWMVCQGDPSWNTVLNITAAFLRNYTQPELIDSEEGGLKQGAIAGIVIGSIVAFLIVVGLIVNLRGSQWFKNLFKNKTHSVPDESPRTAQELERRETGVAGGNDIAHQPSNQVSIQPSPSKDLNRQPLSGLPEPELLGSSSAGGFGYDLNATGQNLLSNVKHSDENHHNGPTAYNSNIDQEIHLPNINVDKVAAAKEWNNLDGEQHLSNPASDRDRLASKRGE